MVSLTDLGEILTVNDAAKELKVSADLIRWLEREGRLPAVRTRSGQRLFLLRDVQQLARERVSRRETPA